MPFAQFRFFLLLLSLTLLCATAPAFASFNGAIDFGFEGFYGGSGVLLRTMSQSPCWPLLATRVYCWLR